MKALVVIDMQNDFIDGALGSNDAIKTVSVIKEKIEKANRENSIVIATRDIHPENYLSDIEGKCVPRHCIRGEKGSEITSAFSNLKFDLIIDKNNFMADPSEQLEIKKALQGVNEIEICGLCADICVVSNALMLRMLCPDAKIMLDSTATAGTSEYNKKAALAVMQSCLVEVY